MNIHELLMSHGVVHNIIEHSPTYKAVKLAEVLHSNSHSIAKTVLLKAGSTYALCVLPANCSVDVGKAATALRVGEARLANEHECGFCFADCEIGVVPPFGSLYGMRTIIDRSMMSDSHLVFEGSNHHQAVRMAMRDYVNLELPTIADFACREA